MAHVEQSGEQDEVLAQIRQLVQKSKVKADPVPQAEDAIMDPGVRDLLAPESPNRPKTKDLGPVDDLRLSYHASVGGIETAEEEPVAKTSRLSSIIGLGKSASALLSRKKETEDEPVLQETSFDQKLGQVFVKPTPVQEPIAAPTPALEADPATGMRNFGETPDAAPSLAALKPTSEEIAPLEPTQMRRFNLESETPDALETAAVDVKEAAPTEQNVAETMAASLLRRFDAEESGTEAVDTDDVATPITEASPFRRLDAQGEDGQEADVIPLQEVMKQAAATQATETQAEAPLAPLPPVAEAIVEDAQTNDAPMPVMSFSSRRFAPEPKAPMDSVESFEVEETPSNPAAAKTASLTEEPVADAPEENAPDAAIVQEVMTNILEQNLAAKLGADVVENIRMLIKAELEAHRVSAE